MDAYIMYILENIRSIILAVVLIKGLLLAIEILVIILIIRLICQYQARENSKAFDYEYMAECIANQMSQSHSKTITEESTKSES